MTLDIHAKNVSCVESNFLGIVCQLDAASLAATADLDLRLDDDGVGRGICLDNRFVNRVGYATG